MRPNNNEDNAFRGDKSPLITQEVIQQATRKECGPEVTHPTEEDPRERAPAPETTEDRSPTTWGKNAFWKEFQLFTLTHLRFSSNFSSQFVLQGVSWLDPHHNPQLLG